MNSLQPLIVGNWKMNGKHSDIQAFCKNLNGRKCVYRGVVCPPATLLHDMSKALPKDIALGAQDCSAATEGAHTGDIAATQLKDAGASYVILGHSERRREHFEPAEVIGEKIQRVLEGSLTPIVCIGESEAIYKQGGTIAHLKEQVESFLPLLRQSQIRNIPFLVAYEPLWAIGTGHQPRSDEIAAIHSALFKMIGEDVLYGGSVKLENYKGILMQPHVGGVLVGGESLKPERFAAMLSGE